MFPSSLLFTLVHQDCVSTWSQLAPPMSTPAGDQALGAAPASAVTTAVAAPTAADAPTPADDP